MLRVRHRGTKSNEKRTPSKIYGIDLFCGAGGLTRGLEAAGINVVMGVDTIRNSPRLRPATLDLFRYARPQVIL
jgi:hypothetical protein